MSRINCHSAFKHYEMFHSRGGDVINIGSNNTTIFNTGAGFGGGSFWSGFGYGLGNGLGSIFGGLFGGNMGGFGNFGFGMSPFGMGGFGMSPFGLGNIFGGGSSRVDSSSDGKGKVKDKNEDKHVECKDPDRKIINDLGSKVKDTIGNKDTKPADVKALYEKIKKAKTDSEKEPNHTETDKKDYENMLGTLKNYAKEKGWGDLDGDNFGIDDKKIVDNSEGKKPVQEAPAKKDNTIENAGNVKFDDKLKEAGNDRNKLLALINDSSLTPEERAKAKAKYAETFGYTNYDGKDTINKDNMKLVTDTGLGSKADITTYVDVKQEAGSHPTKITMQTKNSKTKVTYQYVRVVDGEYIYESQSGNGQRYALQKKGNDYALVQYVYHKGFDDPDVK